MKLYVLFIAISIVTLPACDQNTSNRTNGVKDALDTRPNEAIRDLAEDLDGAAKDVGRDIKNAVKNN